jgi:hypothetical protein
MSVHCSSYAQQTDELSLLRIACLSFLSDRLTIGSALAIYSSTPDNDLVTDEKADEMLLSTSSVSGESRLAFQHILAHADMCLREDAPDNVQQLWTSLSRAQVKALIRSDRLNCPTELDVLRGVMRWIDHDYNKAITTRDNSRPPQPQPNATTTTAAAVDAPEKPDDKQDWVARTNDLKGAEDNVQQDGIPPEMATAMKALGTVPATEAASKQTDTRTKRERYADLIELIRFPLLTIAQLSVHVASADILTGAQLLELYSYIGSNGVLTNSTPFNCEPRHRPTAAAAGDAAQGAAPAAGLQ